MLSVSLGSAAAPTLLPRCGKRIFRAILYYNRSFVLKTIIILPRQARDKHRGKHSKKDALFLQAADAKNKPVLALEPISPVRVKQKRVLFLSAFPMFVPSLSW